MSNAFDTILRVLIAELVHVQKYFLFALVMSPYGNPCDLLRSNISQQER